MQSYYAPYFCLKKPMAAHLLLIFLYTTWVSVATFQAQSEHECLCTALQMLKNLETANYSSWTECSYSNSKCTIFFVQRICQEKGGHLVRVDSFREHNFIKAQLVRLDPDYSQHFWTDGNDLKTEGIWVWGNSTDRITLTYWGSGQPDDSGGEDCLEYSGFLYHEWNNLPCNWRTVYICKIDYYLPGRYILSLMEMDLQRPSDSYCIMYIELSCAFFLPVVHNKLGGNNVNSKWPRSSKWAGFSLVGSPRDPIIPVNGK